MITTVSKPNRKSRRWAGAVGEQRPGYNHEQSPIYPSCKPKQFALFRNQIGPSFNQDDFKANLDLLVAHDLGGIGVNESLKDLGYVHAGIDEGRRTVVLVISSARHSCIWRLAAAS